MSKKEKPISASSAMSERAMTGLFARAFSQPLKLLGQTEASLSSYAVFWCVASHDGSTQVDGRGWIRQQFDDADRRVRRLSLSRKGKTIHARLMKDLAKLSNEVSTA